jgi:hypothetical protein
VRKKLKKAMAAAAAAAAPSAPFAAVPVLRDYSPANLDQMKMAFESPKNSQYMAQISTYGNTTRRVKDVEKLEPLRIESPVMEVLWERATGTGSAYEAKTSGGGAADPTREPNDPLKSRKLVLRFRADALPPVWAAKHPADVGALASFRALMPLMHHQIVRFIVQNASKNPHVSKQIGIYRNDEITHGRGAMHTDWTADFINDVCMHSIIFTPLPKLEAPNEPCYPQITFEKDAFQTVEQWRPAITVNVTPATRDAPLYALATARKMTYAPLTYVDSKLRPIPFDGNPDRVIIGRGGLARVIFRVDPRVTARYIRVHLIPERVQVLSVGQTTIGVKRDFGGTTYDDDDGMDAGLASAADFSAPVA